MHVACMDACSMACSMACSFLFGKEDLAVQLQAYLHTHTHAQVQLEEPFSILPLEALTNDIHRSATDMVHMHTCIHAHVHTCTHAHMCTCTHTYHRHGYGAHAAREPLGSCAHTYMHTIHACIRACFQVDALPLSRQPLPLPPTPTRPSSIPATRRSRGVQMSSQMSSQISSQMSSCGQIPRRVVVGALTAAAGALTLTSPAAAAGEGKQPPLGWETLRNVQLGGSALRQVETVS